MSDEALNYEAIRIHRYALPAPECKIDLPAGAIFRHFGPTLANQSELSIWMEVDYNLLGRFDHRTFCAVNTDDDVPKGAVYLGSAVMADSSMRHLYEVV